jgi:hypothetical protein
MRKLDKFHDVNLESAALDIPRNHHSVIVSLGSVNLFASFGPYSDASARTPVAKINSPQPFFAIRPQVDWPDSYPASNWLSCIVLPTQKVDSVFSGSPGLASMLCERIKGEVAPR